MYIYICHQIFATRSVTTWELVRCADSDAWRCSSHSSVRGSGLSHIPSLKLSFFIYKIGIITLSQPHGAAAEFNKNKYIFKNIGMDHFEKWKAPYECKILFHCYVVTTSIYREPNLRGNKALS